MYGVKPFLRFLLLKQLVSHGKEGDGEPGAKEDDEVGSELVPGLGENVKMLTIFRNKPVVDGEWQIVPRGRQPVATSPEQNLE